GFDSRGQRLGQTSIRSTCWISGRAWIADLFASDDPWSYRCGGYAFDPLYHGIALGNLANAARSRVLATREFLVVVWFNGDWVFSQRTAVGSRSGTDPYFVSFAFVPSSVGLESVQAAN